MTRTTRLATITALALALVVPAAMAADVYKVSARISHDGAVVAEPVMLVNGEVPASVSVSGDDGYSLSIRLDPVEDGQGIEVKLELSTSRGRVSSTVTTQPDRPLSVSTGEMGLELTVTRDAG